ncbi:MAG TPA: histidine--tRNA ligase [Candidatus Thermoplasmatota archaeon]|nr:histidine--tRNA ligase [Candidatus Thermoplasmatota archaeon]
MVDEKKVKFERPRGTRDFRPEQMAQRRWLEGSFRETFRRHGYREIQTPTFEHTDLFRAKSGPNVVKEIYTFLDKGDREICLRPELTAPVLRFYVNELSHEPKPLKLYYYGPCYRYEEPQEGRYREFWQFGLELIGPEGPAADAEAIAVAVAALRGAGLRKFTLHVGHIGVLRALVDAVKAGPRTPEIFRKIDKDADDLEDLLREISPDAGLAAAIASVARHRRTVDLRQASAIDAYFAEAASMIPASVRAAGASGDGDVFDRGLRDLEQIAHLLAAHGVERAELDLGVARGLDYYTGTVFEFHADELGAQSQIGGGGAYSLAELFGGEKVGSCGFGLGFDRILLALEKEGAVPASRASADVYVATLGKGAQVAALALAQEVRARGVSVDVDTMGRGLGKALQHAAKLGARVALIVGEKGLAEGKVTVRDMTSGAQDDVTLAEAPGAIEKRLA